MNKYLWITYNIVSGSNYCTKLDNYFLLSSLLPGQGINNELSPKASNGKEKKGFPTTCSLK